MVQLRGFTAPHFRPRTSLFVSSLRYLIGAIQKVGQINTSAVPRGIAMVSGFPLVVMIKLFDGNF